MTKSQSYKSNLFQIKLKSKNLNFTLLLNFYIAANLIEVMKNWWIKDFILFKGLAHESQKRKAMRSVNVFNNRCFFVKMTIQNQK